MAYMMKQIETFQEAIEYVNRLGFAGGKYTPIVYKQDSICKVAQALEDKAGGYPYGVRFHKADHAPGFPWLGSFSVSGPHGTFTVYANQIK